jgi:hypothetical protein
MKKVHNSLLGRQSRRSFFHRVVGAVASGVATVLVPNIARAAYCGDCYVPNACGGDCFMVPPGMTCQDVLEDLEIEANCGIPDHPGVMHNCDQCISVFYCSGECPENPFCNGAPGCTFLGVCAVGCN